MKDDRLYLEHIREAIDKVFAYTAPGRIAFLQDSMMRDAVIRNFEIIGEAVKRLSDRAKDQHPQVPWRRVAGFRDVLIHNYMDVDMEQVWRVIEVQLPVLRRAVGQLLES